MVLPTSDTIFDVLERVDPDFLEELLGPSFPLRLLELFRAYFLDESESTTCDVGRRGRTRSAGRACRLAARAVGRVPWGDTAH